VARPSHLSHSAASQEISYCPSSIVPNRKRHSPDCWPRRRCLKSLPDVDLREAASSSSPSPSPARFDRQDALSLAVERAAPRNVNGMTNMNAVFKILIAHESLQRGIRAHEMVTRLRAQIPEELAMECEAWKFDWLARPQLRASRKNSIFSTKIVFFKA